MIALFRLALPLLAAGCASEPDRLSVPTVATGIELAAFAIHEQCFALSPGARVAYRFTATRPVAFNVHFREGITTIVPVEVKATVQESDDFTADERRDYCLAWEAGPQGSIIEYRVQLVRPRQ